MRFSFANSLHQVNVESSSLVEILEHGISILVPSYGLIDSFGSKGNLAIEIVPSWENMTFPLWIELLQVCLLHFSTHLQHVGIKDRAR
jgi:hypothetical protein